MGTKAQTAGQHGRDAVRALYEQAPYPPRDPQAERERLIRTVGDALDDISHFGFAGHAVFDADFSVLVAGGGTGDATVFLAEQLRGSGARIVHLDLCARSIAIARERLRVRGLDAVEFVQAPLERLPELDLGRFDYINCCGVLHHLPDPAAGLRALESVLAPGGLMLLMVYGRAAREAVYQLQQMLRLLAPPEMPLARRVEHAVRLIAALPEDHPFRVGFPQWQHDILEYGEAGVADLLLHPQDRAYSITELHGLLAACGLRLVAFAGGGWNGPVGYDPAALIGDPVLRRRLDALDPVGRQAIAELLHLRHGRHFCYVAREPRIASAQDPRAVPVLRGMLEGRGAELAAVLEARGQQTLNLDCDGLVLQITLAHSRPLWTLLRRADGHHRMAGIAAAAGFTDAAALSDAVAGPLDDLLRAGLLRFSDRRLAASHPSSGSLPSRHMASSDSSECDGSASSPAAASP